MQRWIRIAALIAVVALPSFASATPQTERVWLYGNFTGLLTPNLSVTVMPGTRYELGRSGADAKEHYLDELFVGPALSAKFGDLSVKAALWYYFTGFPSQATNTYEYTHSIEVVPTVEYRTGRWSFSDRVILHNTIFASLYDADHEAGYGLVLRNLLQAKYAATDSLTVVAGIEPFVGLIENGDTKPSPAGYWQQGLRLNRIYAGVDWKLTPELSLTPQYVLETAYGSDGNLSETEHYLFLTVAYVMKLFE